MLKNELTLFSIALDASSSTPKNEQLYRTLRQLIEKTLRPGDRLPSTRELADHLGVGRITVTTAYRRLMDEGYLEAHAGGGTVVSLGAPINAVEGMKARSSGAVYPDRVPDLSVRASEAEEACTFRVQTLAPLAVIRPDFDSLPGKKWTQIVARLSKSPWLHNGYCPPGGFPGYRQAIADYVRSSRGIICEPEQVIATTGIQQGVALAAQVLFNAGDKVGAENPGFEPHRWALRFFGARPVPVAVDEEGILVSSLSREPGIRGVLVTPSHQYPMGIRLSMERREALIEWARREGAWIIEDDYDSELRYGGAPYPALAAMDALQEHVIYLGSFTKMIYPGFNLGYLIAPKRAVKAFQGAKLLNDRHVSQVHQAIVTEFINGGFYDAHVRRLKRLYEERRRAAVMAIGRCCASYGKLVASNQGTHLTFLFSENVDDQAFCRHLFAHRRLEARPLSACFWPKGAPVKLGLILGFAGFETDKIAAAIEMLGKEMAAELN